MYKGTRDDHMSIRVPQKNCYPYHSKRGLDLIEVRLPGGTMERWDSFMIAPEQVCYDHINPEQYNILEDINRNTLIQLCTKQANDHAPNGQLPVEGTSRSITPWGIVEAFGEYNI